MEHPLNFSELHPDSKVHMAQVEATRRKVYLLLDRVEDPRNVGAALRLADAANLGGLILYDMEANMLERRIVKKVSRKVLPYIPVWEFSELSAMPELLKPIPLWGLEITDRSTSYVDVQAPETFILAVGNEKKGLSQELIAYADRCIHVPMRGVKTSMNVTMSAAIAIYGLLEVKG